MSRLQPWEPERRTLLYLCRIDNICYIVLIGMSTIVYICYPETRLKVYPHNFCLFSLSMLHVLVHSLVSKTYTTTHWECIIVLSYFGRVVFLPMECYSQREVYTRKILLFSLSMLHIYEHGLVYNTHTIRSLRGVIEPWEP